MIYLFAYSQNKKVPHAAVKENAARAHERAILEQQKKNSSYQLLSDDDDAEEEEQQVSTIMKV